MRTRYLRDFPDIRNPNLKVNSTMAREKLDKLQKRKQQLEEELASIQDELDDSIIKVRHDLGSRLDPKTFIKKYPLPIVGASVLLGFLVGHKRNNNRSDSDFSSSKGEISKTLLAEFKKLATRKALSFATDYLENFLNKKRDEHLSEESTNGSAEG